MPEMPEMHHVSEFNVITNVSLKKSEWETEKHNACLTTYAYTARTLQKFGKAAKPQNALALHSSFGQLLESAPKIIFNANTFWKIGTERDKDMNTYVEIWSFQTKTYKL